MLSLQSPVNHIAGVGPSRERDLARLGIFTVQDLITYYPFRYDDRTVQSGQTLGHDTRVTVQAIVQAPPAVRHKGRRSTMTVQVKTHDGMSMTAVWFNRLFLRDKLRPGSSITITGKYDARRRSLVVSQYEFGSHDTSVHSNRLVPIYEVRGELTPKVLRAILTKALKQVESQIPEILPHSLLAKYKLIPKRDALAQIHLPKDAESLRQARRRLVFEEFFLFQLKLQAFRHLHKHDRPGVAHSFTKEQWAGFLKMMPFELTPGQKRAVRDILLDMRAPQPMNRLLQGDVGSGKTIIAFCAMFAAYLSGYQSAMMVPTEILAEQHYDSASELLGRLGVRIGLLTGSSKESVRKEMLDKLGKGELDIVIGTHALLEDGVEFSNLSLVVTDEQHRFGVEQRSIFRQKGHHPDVLFMSATPIPRTLAMTLFGDLDVSVLDQMPAGRKPIRTHWVTSDKENQVIRFLRKELAKGRQAYIVAPLIEESEKMEGVENAVDLYNRLKDSLAGFQIGLMHGRLSSRDKEDVMRKFKANEIQALVATTVIEVGVNVPNATVMVIYNADRFGLAQLHQLRGRVGRGEHSSICILIADPVSETGRERMQAMVATQNGFVLAEKDLELRGPGEFFGIRQSGMPEFKLGDLVTDANIMKAGREEAQQLMASGDFWILPEYRELVEYLKREKLLKAPIQD
ncbi:ATP-dependent DNA helicase RecG [Effusibacillus lacus]|uniref:ATP-dependent DNA helicase RecG n=1 Tax=Effusibacillus lacus TaxID=1348429 RepID=A0A292YPJ4_9BACL|nr:ATP-dependent DNA helicase RecG [Effusibacillus lacus]TCS76567.1 ATP-dependent DNA helicase RecG [Effusibacillus lacus]GAX90415.1 ATP-dependent DNA helicase RecG [Effusibacillus lacus]